MKNAEYIHFKKAKPFRFGDVFVYIGVAVLIAFLFVYFVISPRSSDNLGFGVFVDGKQVAVYNYGSFNPQITDNSFSDKIVYDKSANTLTVYYGQDNSHFNVIKIDDTKKTAMVKDANCSVSKDCVYTPSLKGDSAIVCVPHKLKIVGLKDKAPSLPTTGGVQ